MPDQREVASGPVYQIKVRLLRVSPMVWRRLLLGSGETLGELHRVIQVAFGCSDLHLHEFQVHGRRYNIPKPGGLWLEDARGVSLASLELREGETFRYTYDLAGEWECEVRLERRHPSDEKQTYPTCIAGSGSGPPPSLHGLGVHQQLTRRRAALGEYLRLCIRLGKLFDPSAFDRQAINEKLQSGYWPRKVIWLGENTEREALRELLAFLEGLAPEPDSSGPPRRNPQAQS